MRWRQRPHRVVAGGRPYGHHRRYEHGNTDTRQVRQEQRLHRPKPTPAASAWHLSKSRRTYLHRLRRMLSRASRALVREPVRSRPGAHRWEFRPIQFLRVTSQDVLDLVPVYLDPGRRVALVERPGHKWPDAECDEVSHLPGISQGGWGQPIRARHLPRPARPRALKGSVVTRCDRAGQTLVSAWADSRRGCSGLGLQSNHSQSRYK